MADVQGADVAVHICVCRSVAARLRVAGVAGAHQFALMLPTSSSFDAANAFSSLLAAASVPRPSNSASSMEGCRRAGVEHQSGKRGGGATQNECMMAGRCTRRTKGLEHERHERQGAKGPLC
jgi:hypothetical protein